MIDLLFTFGAVAEREALHSKHRFDDSQDCLTFLKRRLEGLDRLDQRAPAARSAPPPRRRQARPVAFALTRENR